MNRYSYAGDFFDAASRLKLFWDYEFPFSVVFRNVDISDPDVQRDMMELMDDLQHRPHIKGVQSNALVYIYVFTYVCLCVYNVCLCVFYVLPKSVLLVCFEVLLKFM
jgi:hypothetical protein